MNNYKEYLDPDNGYVLIQQTQNIPFSGRWIEVPEGAEAYFKYGDGTFFVKFPPDWESSNFCDGEWIESAHWSREDILGDKNGRLLWSRQTIQEQGLISGADALRALADGKEVELKDKENNWVGADNHHLLGMFLGNALDFRLKPRTIKLEIEIPAPFDPKVGEEYYYPYSHSERGYALDVFKGGRITNQFGAWRKEAEIKIVVEQLRKPKEHSK